MSLRRDLPKRVRINCDDGSTKSRARKFEIGPQLAQPLHDLRREDPRLIAGWNRAHPFIWTTTADHVIDETIVTYSTTSH